MTSDQLEIINILSQVTMQMGSWDNRFIKRIVHTPTEKTLTENQDEWLYRLLYKYRKQAPVVYKKFSTNPHCQQKPDPNKVISEPGTQNQIEF